MEGFFRLAEYLDGLPGAARQAADAWVERIVLHEQESARQASVNAELAMALWEQSGQLLSQFQKRVAPTERNTYTARGIWNNRPASAALVNGRL